MRVDRHRRKRPPRLHPQTNFPTPAPGVSRAAARPSPPARPPTRPGLWKPLTCAGHRSSRRRPRAGRRVLMLSPRGATDLCGARYVHEPSSRALAGRFQDRRLIKEGGGQTQAAGCARKSGRTEAVSAAATPNPPGGGVKRSGAGLRTQSGAEPWLSHAASHLCRTLYAPSSVDLHSPAAWGLLERRSQYPSPKSRWLAPSPGTSPALLCCAIPARPSGWDLSHLGSCTFKIHPGMVLWI